MTQKALTHKWTFEAGSALPGSGHSFSNDVLRTRLGLNVGSKVALLREPRHDPGMKGVFEISGASRYDDLIAERYHFPRIYLRAAEACVGDWIVYRETGSAGGRKAYVAAGLVHSIDPDLADRTLFYARISEFIEFDRPVPYRDQDGRFLERMLRELDNPAVAGQTLRGRSVRAIDDADFAAIVNIGLVDTLSPEHAIRLELDLRHLDAPTAALLASPPDERRGAQLLEAVMDLRGLLIHPRRDEHLPQAVSI